jgi:hypothetical protein
MRKKQKIGIFDIGRLPVVPVKYADAEKPTTTLAAFRADEARREAESAARLQSAIAEQQAQASRTIKACLETSAPLKARFWSQPLDRLKVSLNDEDAYDELFLRKDSADVDSNEIYDKVMAFVTNVPSLESDDERRFSLYVACQVLNDVVVDDESLKVMFDRCLSLGIFNGDADFQRPIVQTPKPRAVEPEPQRESLDDMDTIDTSTRDGLRRAQNLAENLYVEEMLPIATQWVTSIQKHYGFSPTSEDMRRVSDWIAKNNLNRLAPQTYDAARRWLVASGFWPEGCLTEIEKYNRDLEQVDLTRITHEQKQMLRRREMQARESDLARYGHI